MAGIREIDLVQTLRKRVEQAISATAENDSKRRKAIRQFLLEPTGTEEEDYSTAQSADVAATVTADLALLSVSLAPDMPVEFEAESAEDEVRAKAESRAVTKILFEENNGIAEILDACQNDMLCGPGVVKVWIDEDVNSYFVRHDQITEEDLSVIARKELGIDRRLVRFDPETGTARVEVTETKKRLRLKAVSPDRFFIDPDWEERTFDGCTLVGEIHFKTRDELSRMGVPWSLVRELTPVNKSDYGNAGRRQPMGLVEPMQLQTEVCRVYLVYARLTWDDNDDRAYLYKCWLGESGDEFLLEPELASRIPYATATGFPLAHSFMGIASASRTGPVQDGKTELIRQLNANIRNTSWGRLGIVSSSADAADILRPKPGGVIRIRNPDAIVPIPVQDVGPSIMLGLDAFDKQRAERVGASLDLGSAPLQVASDSAHATERQFSAQETVSGYRCRNYSEMVRQVAVLGHAELRSGELGPIPLKVSEKWTTEDPSQWRERRWCNVSVAPSFGERVHMSNALSMCMQWDMALLQAGMQDTLISMPGVYKKITDWLRLNLIPNPEAYYIDPASEQAQQAGQQKAQAAQQQAAQQSEMIMGIEKGKTDTDRYKTDNDTSWKYFNTLMEVQAKMALSDIQGTVDVIRAKADSEIARSANALGNPAGGGAAANGSGKRNGGSPGGGARGGAGAKQAQGN